MTDKWDRFILYGGKVPTLELPDVPLPEGYTGCYWDKGVLIHTNMCECDEQHDRAVDKDIEREYPDV